MKNIDPRMLFGFVVLIGIIVLNGIIALGTVTEANSYGLDKGMTVLAMLATGFSTWAFTKPNEPKNEPKPDSVSDQSTPK